MKTLIQNADVLFTVPEVVCRRANLLLEDGRIVSVDAPADTPADTVIDGTGKLVSPGLINCHTHAYMTVFRDYADDLPFNEWLFEKIMPVEDAMTPDDAYWSNQLACLEMIKSGTTCFLDMHMFKDQCVSASRQAGMRAVVSRGLSAESAADPGGARRLQEALDEIDGAGDCGDMTTFMLGPHAIYTCDTGYLRDLVAVAREKNLRFHIHLSETKYEFDTCMTNNGTTPTQHLAGVDFFTVPTVAAHCVHLTDEDIRILGANGVSAASCPVSNMKLGNGFAPVRRLLDAGVNLCIGTDGAASNNNLNMFKEMSIFSYIHKGVEQDVLMTPAKEVLRMGTLNGARALGLESVTGSIEVGKKADLILLDLNRASLRPANNLVSAMIYSSGGAEVDTVLIDGRVVMEKGEVKTLDEERIYAEMDRVQKRLLG